MQKPKVPSAQEPVDLAGSSSAAVAQPSAVSAPYAGQHKDPNAMYAALKRNLAVPNRSGTKPSF